MSEIFKLYRLQQVDSQLDQLNQRLEEIEKILGDDQEMQTAMQALEQAKTQRLENEQALKFAEEEVRQQQIKIEHNQASLYGGTITNPKELQDLQAEAASLGKQLSSLEDKQLEHMELLEQSQSEELSAQEGLSQLSKTKHSQHGELLSEQQNLLMDQEKLETEAAATTSSIPPAELSLYRKTRQTKNGLAVAKIENRACSACGNQLSQALLQAARTSKEPTRCSTCKRILYSG